MTWTKPIPMSNSLKKVFDGTMFLDEHNSPLIPWSPFMGSTQVMYYVTYDKQL